MSSNWCALPKLPDACRAADVHLIRIALCESRYRADDDWSVLSDDEEARAARYRVESPRRRFRLCRRAVRRCLGWLTQVDPAALRFASERNGKPILQRPADTGLTFNVSHTGDWGVLAVSWRRQLGVDIESIDPQLDTHGLSRRYFSPDEQSQLAQLPAAMHTAGFYRLWTSKEAYMKALGLGMLLPLGSFTMSADPDLPPAFLSGDLREGPWQAAAFAIADDVPGVLLYSGEPAAIHHWDAPADW